MFLFSATFFPLSQYPDAVAGDRAGHAAVPGRRARARRSSLGDLEWTLLAATRSTSSSWAGSASASPPAASPPAPALTPPQSNWRQLGRLYAALLTPVRGVADATFLTLGANCAALAVPDVLGGRDQSDAIRSPTIAFRRATVTDERGLADVFLVAVVLDGDLQIADTTRSGRATKLPCVVVDRRTDAQAREDRARGARVSSICSRSLSVGA